MAVAVVTAAVDTGNSFRRLLKNDAAADFMPAAAFVCPEKVSNC
jgi:hypothetical protein